MRKEAQSAHCSTDSETEDNTLESKIVSLNFTVKEKERMTDRIELDLNRSESQVGRFCSKFWSIKMSLRILTGQPVLLCQTDRTPVARDAPPSRDPNISFSRDHKAGATRLRLQYFLTKLLLF